MRIFVGLEIAYNENGARVLFLNARNGVGHQINQVEEIIPDLLLCAKCENCYKG